MTDGLREKLKYAIQKAEVKMLVIFKQLLSAIVENSDLAGNVVFLHLQRT